MVYAVIYDFYTLLKIYTAFLFNCLTCGTLWQDIAFGFVAISLQLKKTYIGSGMKNLKLYCIRHVFDVVLCWNKLQNMEL